MTGLALAGAVVMLLAGGIASGNMWCITVDRLSVWTRMSIVDYATDFRRLLKNVDPMMPILVGLSGVGAVIVAIQTSGLTSALAWAVLGCQVLIILTSATLAEPVNSKFRRLPEGTPPERADYYQTFWARFHRLRTLASVVAFILAVSSVVAY